MKYDFYPKKVTIILLNYNNYKDTIECLKSLSNITYINFTIVIVDNNSTDNSWNEIKTYLEKNKKGNFFSFKCIEDAIKSRKSYKYILIQSGYNGGYGYGNNIGIKYALQKGTEYILIINNDTVIKEDILKNLIDFYEKNSKVGILGSKICYYDKPSVIWFNGGKFYHCSAKVKHFNFNEIDRNQKPNQPITFITGCFWLIHRNVFEKVGLINENYFMYMEDLEFCNRVIKSGYKLEVSYDTKIYHKIPYEQNGRLSNFRVYWMSRNKMKFIHENLKLPCKISAYLYTIVVPFLRFLLQRKFELIKIHLKGILDFFKDKFNHEQK